MRTGSRAGVRILEVPYDSGRKDFRMGLGPARLIECGIGGLPGVSIEKIEVEDRAFELGVTIQLLRSIAEKVRAAIADNCFPIVLAGGCISSVGVLAGIGEPAGVVWFDAHGDFNTPETTPSGFIDGMALAMLAGRCWGVLAASIPEFRPVAEKNMILVGARDLDPEERRALENSNIRSLDPETFRTNGGDGFFAVRPSGSPDAVYLHIDLDVLDRREAFVNQFSSTGGLTLSELLEIIRLISRRRAVVAAAITAYDPSADESGKAAKAGVAVVQELLAAACIDLM